MRPKIAKDAHPVGTCTACGSMVFKRHKRVWLTCACLLQGRSVSLKTQGTFSVPIETFTGTTGIKVA